MPGSDAARYKLWGNGIALPCAVHVLHQIVKVVEQDDAEASALLGL